MEIFMQRTFGLIDILEIEFILNTPHVIVPVEPVNAERIA
jgi:hypothetical protein